jgi:hypothetical protein
MDGKCVFVRMWVGGLDVGMWDMLGEDWMFCEKTYMKINCCLLTCGGYIYIYISHVKCKDFNLKSTKHITTCINGNIFWKHQHKKLNSKN